MYLCVFCGSENKQRLFPYTALTDCFLKQSRREFTARYGDFTAQFTLHNALPWLRPSVTDLSWRRPAFDLRSAFVRFVGGQSGSGTAFPSLLLFSPVSIIPPLLHTQLNLHAALTKRTNERRLGTFQKVTPLRIWG